MRRDLDLIRGLLIRFEDLGLDDSMDAALIEVPPWTQDQVIYHCFLMAEAGLIRGVDVSTHDGKNIIVTSLTNFGHEYLDDIRSDTVWNKVKSQAASQGLSITLDTAKAVAVFYGKQLLGLP